MKTHDVQELLRLDWYPVCEADPDGGVAVRIAALDDFVVYAEDEASAWADYRDALESHLKGYLNTGKVVPLPIRMQQNGAGVDYGERDSSNVMWYHVPTGMSGQAACS